MPKGWKRIFQDGWGRLNKWKEFVYIMPYKGGYTVNYGQAPLNFEVFPTIEEARKDAARHMEMFGPGWIGRD